MSEKNCAACGCDSYHPCDCDHHCVCPSPVDVGPEDLCEPTSPEAIRFLTSFPKSESLDHLLDAPSPTDEERPAYERYRCVPHAVQGCMWCRYGECEEPETHEASLARARSEGRREGIEAATNLLIGCWDDGDQGPPRSEIEQYAEIVLLRALADEGKDGG